MQWKETLTKSLEEILNAPERDDLFASLEASPPTSLRLNNRKPGSTYSTAQNIPWCPEGFYLEERPSFQKDVDFHVGRYYVQEASSMFLSHVLRQIDLKPQCILDMCAAPGGKSSLLIDAFPDALVVANEVDGKRHAILEENLTKWGATNVLLAQASSKMMHRLGSSFDLILIDAPCSGEGMLRKSDAAKKQYNHGLITHCAGMQEKILDQVIATLRPGGILIYSTCTWNREENEDHFVARRELNPLSISIPIEWNIFQPVDPKIPMHRFFPHRTRGEGLCMGIFQKQDTDQQEKVRNKKGNSHFKPYNSLSFSLTDHAIFQNSLGYLSALPDIFGDDLDRLSAHMQCRPLLTLGTLDRKDKLIPNIALAQQTACELPYHKETLGKEDVAKYLRRASLPGLGRPGEWILACHEDLPMGFMKDVGRRCNNTYPISRAIR